MADDSMDFVYGQEDEEWVMDLDSLQIDDAIGGVSGDQITQGDSNRHATIQNKRAEIDNKIQGLRDNNVLPEEERRRIEQKEKRNTGEVQHLPPGVKLFSGSPFTYFTHHELDLIRDFKYQPKHLERGISTEEHLLKLLRNPLQFVMFLSPETTSKVIQSKEDYVAVCEFLIYSLIGYSPIERKRASQNGANTTKKSPLDGWTYDLYHKALFDLIRNYSYKEWKLTYKHLLVALMNFGADETLLLDQNFYDEALKPTRQREEKSKFKINQSWPPFFVAIWKQLSEEGGVNRTPHSEADIQDYLDRSGGKLLFKTRTNPYLKHLQMTCVEKFVKLFTDLTVTFEKKGCIMNNELMPKADPKNAGGPWGQSFLVVYYLISTVCLDTYCLRLPNIQFNLSRVFAQICNRFSTKQFWGDEEKESKGETPSIYDIKHLEFTASKHVRSHPEVWAFQDKETPDSGILHFGCDHHHNMVERVRILPATYRCRQLRRALALMWLKQILNHNKPGEYINLEQSHRADVSMVANLLEEKKAKLSVLSKNAYLYVSVILLIDLVVGAEPPLQKEDPNSERKKTAIARVKVVLEEVKRELEGAKGEDAEEFKKWKDFYGQFPKKWALLYEDKGKRQKQTHMDDYFNSLGRAVSRHELSSQGPSSQETIPDDVTMNQQ